MPRRTIIKKREDNIEKGGKIDGSGRGSKSGPEIQQHRKGEEEVDDYFAAGVVQDGCKTARDARPGRYGGENQVGCHFKGSDCVEASLKDETRLRR